MTILGNSTEPGNAQLVREMELAAAALKLQLKHLEVRDSTDIETAFSGSTRDRPDAINVLRNPIAATRRKQVVDFAAKYRLPAMHTTPEWVELGGLMSYAPDFLDNWRRAATYVDKIIKGVKLAELPLEQPTRFELITNLKTAKQIGLAIPPNLLAREDRVVR